MLGRINVRYEQCTGCRACQTACSIKKENTLWPEASRIKVLQVGNGPLDIPISCHQCADHPCVAACPPKIQALSFNPQSGVVIVDDKKCLRAKGVQCKGCAKACPAQTVTYHPQQKVPLFCDLCDGDPACVKACGPQALAFNKDPCFDSKHFNRTVEDIAENLIFKIYGRNDIK
ncbi:MAG: 4Fe-4S dicluster domain-containing protein [Bacillota bacterium]